MGTYWREALIRANQGGVVSRSPVKRLVMSRNPVNFPDPAFSSPSSCSRLKALCKRGVIKQLSKIKIERVAKQVLLVLPAKLFGV